LINYVCATAIETEDPAIESLYKTLIFVRKEHNTQSNDAITRVNKGRVARDTQTRDLQKNCKTA